MACSRIAVKALQLYVFDDTDPDESTYLGVARIPLVTLAHDKPVQGTFELTRVFTNILFCLLMSALGLTLFSMN